MNKIVEAFLLNKRSIYEKQWEALKCADNLDRYKLNTSLRLIKTIIKYRRTTVSELDMLSSLRSYLMLYKEAVSVADDILACIKYHEGRFGLRLDMEQKVYVVADLPSCINSELVNAAFMQDIEDAIYDYQKEGYFLGVSPYIYHLTGFKYYKSIAQKLAITGALNTPEGYTSLIALSTGGGKSLVTQTVAYQQGNSLTVVIIPTVSLALDQVRAAKNNIRHDAEDEIFCYYSGISEDKINHMLQCINDEKARIVFLSPESIIKNKKIKDTLKKANDKKYLKNIIIDEAHIVIEWGAFFRIDYQCLEAWRKELYEEHPQIRTFLLSATYEEKTVENLKLMFAKDKKWIEIRCDALRKEPRYLLVETKSYVEKNRKLLELVEKLPRPMILYVTSPDTAENLKKLLQEEGYSNIETFTGKTSSAEREKIIEEWANNEQDLIIATSAFGVGVDKSDVRTVLHLYIPENPNKYYQELGRGGRDGLPCLSVMCVYKQEDLNETFKRVDKVLSVDKIMGRWFSMYNSPLSERYDESILIDTTIKPAYNNEDDLYEDLFIERDVNKVDMKWNIYVLLLLRRYDLITILGMFYDREKYYIKIKINDYTLINQEQDVLDLINEIREKEKSKADRDFRTMRSAIEQAGKTCWSEMFCETYKYVSEYCAGCEVHTEIIFDAYNKFPLVKPIKEPVRPLIEYSSIITKDSTEIQIIDNWQNQNVVRKLVDMGISTIVLDEYCQKVFINLLEGLPNHSNINMMGVKEFEALYDKKCYYYISGSILLLYNAQYSRNQNKMAILAKRLAGSGAAQCIHLLKHKIYISEMSKEISEMIEGPRYEGYIIEKMEV